MSNWVEIGAEPITTTFSKTYKFNRDDYNISIYEKFLLGLQEYFKLSREEVIKRGGISDYQIFDSLFTPEVLERNNQEEINQIYKNTPFFAFRNPIYYANREIKAFEPFWKPIVEKPGSVLDHGAGAGVFIEVLLRKGIKDVTYADVQGSMQDFVKWFFGDKIKYENDPNNIQGFYDYITSNSVLEHLPDPIKTIRMFGEHLKPGGKIIASMATDIHGQHLKKAIDKYNEVMSLIGEINRKSQIYYDIQISGSAWTTKSPHYQQMVKDGIVWMVKNMDKRPRSILDLGCGDGWSTEEIRRQLPSADIKIVGGDIDPGKLEDAKQRNVIVEYQDMHNVIGKWSSIFCSHALEHSYDYKKAIKSILDALAPGGNLYLIVPIEPIDPTGRNPSHTQWFETTDKIKNEILIYKNVKIIAEETKTRDTPEYWVIIKKTK